MSTVEYRWEPDPQVLANKFFSVEAGLRDRSLPLALAAEQTLVDIRERFATHTAPDGTPWDEWSDSYAPVAFSYPNIDLLRQDDDLYEAVVGSTNMIINNDTVFFQTDMPEYGVWHQEGRPTRKTRQGTPNPLPQRQFLGLSDQATAAIFVTFSQWFERTLDLFVTTTGRVGQRHAQKGGGPGGTRFVKRSEPIAPRVRGTE